MTKLTGIMAVLALLPASGAFAQAVVTPNTEPSQQTIGGKDAKPASSTPGAGTVQGREMSNGKAPAEPDPTVGPAKPQR